MSKGINLEYKLKESFNSNFTIPNCEIKFIPQFIHDDNKRYLVGVNVNFLEIEDYRNWSKWLLLETDNITQWLNKILTKLLKQPISIINLETASIMIYPYENSEKHHAYLNIELERHILVNVYEIPLILVSYE